MSWIDYITIILFVAGILAVGLSFSKTGTNMRSFFAANGSVPWWISGLSLFMGFFSAGTFVVWGSIAYSSGLVSIIIQACMCIAGFAVALFIAPRWKQTRVLTAAEYISLRLGVQAQKIYTYLFLLVSLFTTGSFLYPVAKIVEVCTGLPLQWSIILLGAVSMLYVAVGGLRAVVVTDVIQFVILSAAVLIVIPLSFGRIGGVENFIDQARMTEGFLKCTNSEYTWLFLIAFCIYNTFFLGGNWSYVQRYTSVPDTQSARKTALLFGALYMICPILWMLPPMIYRFAGGELVGLADEGAYLLMCKMVLPQGLLGLMLGGMIFATASSLNGTLNISAGVITNDIYHRIFPHADNRSLMRVARISTFVLGALAVVVALMIPKLGGIVNMVISIAALTGVPLYLPVIWTLFSKRQTKQTILFTTLFSLGINLFFKFITPIWGLTLNRTQEMLVGALVPVVLLTVVEIYLALRHYTDPATISCAAAIEERKAQQEEERKALEIESSANNEANKQSRNVIGLGIGLTGVAIAIIGGIATAGGQVLPVVFVVAALLIGIAIWIRKK